MKIVADDKIPFLKGVFEPYAEVLYRNGADINAADVEDADALIVRTRTICGCELLDGSRVKTIATATIGFDHIDTRYCLENKIKVHKAAGCNARAVAQYVFAAIEALGVLSTKGLTLGVVGVGNVGGVVSQVGESMGFRVLRNDPPRADREGNQGFTELDTLLCESDIVTIHTPLDHTTHLLASTRFFETLKRGAIFINSSRGEVTDDSALLAAIMRHQLRAAVVDVWHDEPVINRELLSVVDIATPHIAGYSLQGKAMGSAMSVRSVAKDLGIDELTSWYPSQVEATTPRLEISWAEFRDLIHTKYNIWADDKALRDNADLFERLRNEYCYRNEFF